MRGKQPVQRLTSASSIDAAGHITGFAPGAAAHSITGLFVSGFANKFLLASTALVAVGTWAPLNVASAQVNVVANGTTVDLSAQPAFPISTA
jgi:hypothetical protein